MAYLEESREYFKNLIKDKEYIEKVKYGGFREYDRHFRTSIYALENFSDAKEPLCDDLHYRANLFGLRAHVMQNLFIDQQILTKFNEEYLKLFNGEKIDDRFIKYFKDNVGQNDYETKLDILTKFNSNCGNILRHILGKGVNKDEYFENKAIETQGAQDKTNPQILFNEDDINYVKDRTLLASINYMESLKVALTPEMQAFPPMKSREDRIWYGVDSDWYGLEFYDDNNIDDNSYNRERYSSISEYMEKNSSLPPVALLEKDGSLYTPLETFQVLNMTAEELVDKKMELFDPFGNKVVGSDCDPKEMQGFIDEQRKCWNEYLGIQIFELDNQQTENVGQTSNSEEGVGQ